MNIPLPLADPRRLWLRLLSFMLLLPGSFKKKPDPEPEPRRAELLLLPPPPPPPELFQ